MFKSSETGQVFKENQSLNNNIRYILFSEGCFRVEDEEGGVKTIWPWSCVLALEHSSSEMCVCVCEDRSYSAHILMQRQGKLPSCSHGFWLEC